MRGTNTLDILARFEAASSRHEIEDCNAITHPRGHSTAVVDPKALSRVSISLFGTFTMNIRPSRQAIATRQSVSNTPPTARNAGTARGGSWTLMITSAVVSEDRLDRMLGGKRRGTGGDGNA